MADYHDQLNQLGSRQVAQWLYERFHGRDTLCPPPNPREQERRCSRVLSLRRSPDMTDSFKLHLLDAVHGAVLEAAANPKSGRWSDPVALDSLFLTAVDVCEGLEYSRRRIEIGQALQKLSKELPIERNNVAIKMLAATAFARVRVPPADPKSFWISLWQDVIAQDREEVGFASVVFGGLYQQTDLATACEWLATADPWDEETVLGILDDHLDLFVTRSDKLTITQILEQHLMLPLKDEIRRWAIREQCLKHELSLWTPVRVPREYHDTVRELLTNRAGIVPVLFPVDPRSDVALATREAAVLIETLLQRVETNSKGQIFSPSEIKLWAIAGQQITIEIREQRSLSGLRDLALTVTENSGRMAHPALYLPISTPK